MESLKTASWSADQNPVSKDGGSEKKADCGSGDRQRKKKEDERRKTHI